MNNLPHSPTLPPPVHDCHSIQLHEQQKTNEVNLEISMALLEQEYYIADLAVYTDSATKRDSAKWRRSGRHDSRSSDVVRERWHSLKKTNIQLSYLSVHDDDCVKYSTGNKKRTMSRIMTGRTAAVG